MSFYARFIICKYFSATYSELIFHFRNLNEVKKKLGVGTIAKNPPSDGLAREDSGQKESLPAVVQVGKKHNRKKVLDVPLHRQAKNRIESEIAYAQTRFTENSDLFLFLLNYI
jgi:hypothetical protein